MSKAKTFDCTLFVWFCSQESRSAGAEAVAESGEQAVPGPDNEGSVHERAAGEKVRTGNAGREGLNNQRCN